MTAINVSQAQIKTASIEIKTLTIEKKQVTLSVFRQIKDEPLIDEATLQLRGIPWGNINYFWGDQKHCDSNNAFHVVWQENTELRRSVIPKNIGEFDVIRKIKSSLRDQECHQKQYIINYNNEGSQWREKWKEWNIPWIKNRIKNIEGYINVINSGMVKATFYGMQNACDNKPHYSEEENFSTKENIDNYLNQELSLQQSLLSRAENAYNIIEKEKINAIQSELEKISFELKKILVALSDLPQLFIAI